MAKQWIVQGGSVCLDSVCSLSSLSAVLFSLSGSRLTGYGCYWLCCLTLVDTMYRVVLLLIAVVSSPS